jgi:ferritin-like metal-binding protein YciE
MKSVNNLVDLLMYQLANLHSVEEQILHAIPSIVEKANHTSVKNTLKHHASLTTQQKERLTQIPELIKAKLAGTSISEVDRLDMSFTSQGMMGLIEEINQLLESELSNEVKDAAIIASVQKIEHYEICAYGTAVAYAKQLNLPQVAALLNETLQEEYDADDLLTALATAAINKEGLPEGLETRNDTREEKDVDATNQDQETEHTIVSISERTINSPGGRAGTSHRRYGTGESRGH